MSKKDIIHNGVRNALVKDGWTITDDPYTIVYEDATLFADLGAERPLAAEREGNKIAVEIKSFLNPSPMNELESALGQYQIYRSFLEFTDAERKVYLAINDDVYYTFFQRKSVQLIVQKHQLTLLVVNILTEEIMLWTS